MNQEQEQLRIPICGIFGHVDSGKTSFLSKLKSYETIEAGGITQGVSSIFISIEKMKSLCEKVEDLKQLFTKKTKKKVDSSNFEIKIPGVLFIDTPGHEAFNNFRLKASDICDLAIIIIDIEKGVEKQASDSIQMLKAKKIPFIILLTKLDKIYNWNSINTSNLNKSLKEQSSETINMFNVQIEDVKYELSKYEISAELYFKNKTPAQTYSIIPISNKSGEGFNDMINFVIYIIQNFMEKKLVLDVKTQMFVMEKTFDKQLGWTINVILSNGTLNVGDNFIIQTSNGPISSVIRSIIGLNFDKSKKKYIHTYQTKVSASNSVIIFAPELKNVITGEFAHTYSSNEEYKKYLTQFENKELKESFVDSIKTDKPGFYLFSSTEDEFEAGYNVFKSNDITISNGSIGSLNKRIVDMFEIYINKLNLDLEEYKILIYYTSENNKVPNFLELEEYAKKKGIKLIFNDVIYKLLDQFKSLKDNLINNRKETLKKEGRVYLPLEMKLLKQHVYMKGGSANILSGFKILQGKVNVGTEIISINPKNPSEIHVLGKIMNMEKNHKEINEAFKNDEVCIRLENLNHLNFPKHFNETSWFFSNINRTRLEILKRDFKTELTKEDWLLTARIIKYNRMINM